MNTPMRALCALIVLAIAVATLVAGCGAPSSIDASAVAGSMRIVLDRHDAYVLADPKMNGPAGLTIDGEAALESTAALRSVWSAAGVPLDDVGELQPASPAGVPIEGANGGGE